MREEIKETKTNRAKICFWKKDQQNWLPPSQTGLEK